MAMVPPACLVGQAGFPPMPFEAVAAEKSDWWQLKVLPQSVPSSPALTVWSSDVKSKETEMLFIIRPHHLI